MQKCPKCGMRKIQEERVLEPQTGNDIGSRTVCKNCQAVISDHSEAPAPTPAPPDRSLPTP